MHRKAPDMATMIIVTVNDLLTWQPLLPYISIIMEILKKPNSFLESDFFSALKNKGFRDINHEFESRYLHSKIRRLCGFPETGNHKAAAQIKCGSFFVSPLLQISVPLFAESVDTAIQKLQQFFLCALILIVANQQRKKRFQFFLANRKDTAAMADQNLICREHGRSVATGQPAEKPTGPAPNPCEAAGA